MAGAGASMVLNRRAHKIPEGGLPGRTPPGGLQPLQPTPKETK